MLRFFSAAFDYLTESNKNLLGCQVTSEPDHSFWWHWSNQPIPSPAEVIEREPPPSPIVSLPPPKPEPKQPEPYQPTRMELVQEAEQRLAEDLELASRIPDDEMKDSVTEGCWKKYHQRIARLIHS